MLKQRGSLRQKATILAKKFTIIVIPENGGSSFRFSLGRIVLLVVAIISLSYAASLYFFVKQYREKRNLEWSYQKLKKENNGIRSEAQALKTKMQEVEEALEAIDSIAEQVKSASQYDPTTGKIQKSSIPAPQNQISKKEKDDSAMNYNDSPTTDIGEVKNIGPITQEDYEIYKKYLSIEKNVESSSLTTQNLEFQKTFQKLSELHLQTQNKGMELQNLLKNVRKYQIKISGIPTIQPVSGRISSIFGVRKSPFTGKKQMHWGIDIAAPKGTPIKATASGHIIYTGWKNAYGKAIDIQHTQQISTRYAHLHLISAQKGDLVQKGQIIGYVGSTGRSTGPHLHYEVKINNRRVNPKKFILSRNNTTTASLIKNYTN